LKKYIVIERFKAGCCDRVYQRYDTAGRMLPPGLHYLNSWVNRERSVCYQLMETGDAALFDAWTARWSDLVDFEIVPVD
jgi:hypothetical protein